MHTCSDRSKETMKVLKALEEQVRDVAGGLN